MRKFKTEDELKAMARGMTGTIVDRTTDNMPEIRRETTDVEKETLYKIVYGALLELNTVSANAMPTSDYASIVFPAEKAIVDTTEFIFGRFFPNCNSYDSLYKPLLKIMDAWVDESWEIPLAEWYAEAYPSDDIVEYMNPEATFRNLYDALENGRDVYRIIGVGDSVVRERLFEGLTSICGKSYNEIYEMWLNKGRKKVC